MNFVYKTCKLKVIEFIFNLEGNSNKIFPTEELKADNFRNIDCLYKLISKVQ
ncbi:hypothetical protein [Dethiothermospora halolimnae]|uniref:hypothetical protein n=1 Tax=Dethiothermospora halolimnae TaxID=3114390 RepID=UPI003CCBA9A5